MDLIPAIDLLGGRVVRLEKGDYDRSTAYSEDPVAQAVAFEAAGATRLHVVDLDGAKSGQPAHLALMRAILNATSLSVQVGGGIRTLEAAERWLASGAERVVLGTVAVKDPDLASALCGDYPDRIVIAIDARGDDVAIEGWQTSTGQSVLALARRCAEWGAAAILYTDIDRDGTKLGPALERTVALQGEIAIPVIASGGIGSLDDLRALRDAEISAAVCGRALYTGAFTLQEGLRISRNART